MKHIEKELVRLREKERKREIEREYQKTREKDRHSV